LPLYIFECKACGEYTRRKSIHENLSNDVCPECFKEARRVYTPFMTNRLEKKLSHAIESGMEPKIMKKSELPKSNLKKNQNSTRPWMN